MIKFPSPNPPSGSNAAALALDAVLIVSDGHAVGASAEDASLLALVDGRRTVAEILRVSRLSGSVAMRRLRALSDRRVVRAVAARFPASGRITNPMMAATQDLSAAADAFVTTMATAQKNERPAGSSGTAAPRLAAPVPGARSPAPSERAAPAARVTVPRTAASPTLRRIPTPPGVRQRITPPMAQAQAAPATVVVVDPELSDFHNMPATPPPEPTRAPPAPAARPVPVVTGALVPTSRPTSRTEIVERRPPRSFSGHAAGRGFSSELHDLWFRLANLDWATLVLVPAHNTGSAVPVARGLAEVGSSHLGRAIAMFSAEGRDLDSVEDLVFPRQKDERHTRIIAIEPLGANPRGVAVAKAADAVVLVVERGITDLRSAKRAIDKIGKQRVVGCVMLPAPETL